MGVSIAYSWVLALHESLLPICVPEIVFCIAIRNQLIELGFLAYMEIEKSPNMF